MRLVSGARVVIEERRLNATTTRTSGKVPRFVLIKGAPAPLVNEENPWKSANTNEVDEKVMNKELAPS
jgi:hypothetical protein